MQIIKTQTDPDIIYETIATIFAVAVMIDEVEHDRELIEFAHACCFHNRLIRPTRINPKASVINWFRANAPKIEKRLIGHMANTYIISLLRQIGDPELQRTVLASIFAICIADSELHPAEADLIQLVKTTWRIAMPTPEAVEAVV